MASPTQLAKQISSVIRETGDICRIQYFNSTFSGASYDEEYVTQSGADVWARVTILPVSSTTTGEDYKYLEEGKIVMDDRKIYVAGSINLNATIPIKIGLGSPVRLEYSFMNEGRIPYRYGEGGSILAWKGYVRALTTGSFQDEY